MGNRGTNSCFLVESPVLAFLPLRQGPAEVGTRPSSLFAFVSGHYSQHQRLRVFLFPRSGSRDRAHQPHTRHLCCAQKRANTAGLSLSSLEGPAWEGGPQLVSGVPTGAVLCIYTFSAKNVIYDETLLSFWESGIWVHARQRAQM